MFIVLYLVALVVLSTIFVGFFRLYAIKKNLLDHPNCRSSHVIPTPRGGGIVFLVLWLLFMVAVYCQELIEFHHLLLFVPGSILISLVGYWDDHQDISAKVRLLIQVVVAVTTVVLLGGFPILHFGSWILNWGWLGWLIACIAIVWSINLYNFMDGIDGIAAVEALFVFGVGGYFVWQAGGLDLAVLIWAVAAIVLGFLFWNKPPAKIFMGDVGSALLGFLVVVFALAGEIWYKVPAILWLILYGVFWFDATVTLLRRITHKEVWYQAHRSHSYQRLQLGSWSHGRILLAVILLNMVLTLLAFLTYIYPNYVLLWLLMVFLLLSIAYVVVEKFQPMYRTKK